MALGWILLAAAIAAEIVATTSLKLTEGFSKLVPSTVVIVGYVVSFVCLSFALSRGIPLGVAYAIWSGVGLAAVATISYYFFDEKLGLVGILGIVLIGAGVVVLEVGSHGQSP